jgi:hypothetical protein
VRGGPGALSAWDSDPSEPRLLDGASRSVLGAMAVPVLMSH